MKIVFLSFYSGVVYRGVETYVHELADRLAKSGHDVTVFQNGPNTYGGSYKTESIGIKVSFFKSGNMSTLLNQIIGANADRRFTQKALRKIGKDVDILVATNNRFQALISRIWCLFKKTKLIIPGQGGPGIDERFALMCFPDAFVPLSNFQKEWAKRANPFVNVSEVIHNGVSLNKFSDKNKKIDFGLKGKIILCAAALWPIMKRQQLLIKAVSKLKGASLLLAGDGEGKAYLEKLGREYLGDRFLIKSFTYDQMPNVYASCDLFSFPTWPPESFGIVMVEAMASGLPVVASDDPIRREIVGEAGLFVDPKNTSEYANTLKKALEKKWGELPRKNAEDFSWEKIAEKYEKLFETITKAK